MNLVQINERLKDLPMQVLQQYANGMNPEVPPYLALGELQRREMSQKQAATAQGAAQGPQPSVKEQVEQKAGLMALQQMQQQQMAQQMQQPRGPMPVPPGAPQPEAQPQPEMMARGGLAGIPVRRDMFEYAGGGIIAFQSGGDVKKKYERETAEMGEGKRMQFSPDVQAYAKQLRAAANAEQEGFAERERQRMLSQSREIAPEREAAMAGPNVTEQTMRRVGPMTAPKFADPRMATATQPEEPAGLPAALQKAAPAAAPRPSPMAGAPMPGAPRPAPAQVGAPAAPQTGLPAALAGAPAATSIPVSPDRAELEAMMKSQQRTEPTAQGVISDVNALMPEGMRDEATKKRFAEQRARAEAGNAAYEKSKPTGLDNLIRVLGQAGQYKGFSGIGPAYTSMQQQRRAEDLAFQKQQDELLTAIESRERGADKDTFTARTGAMDRAQQLFGQSQKSILEAAAAKLGASQGRLDKEAQLNMQRDLEMFRAQKDIQLKQMDIGQRNRELAFTAANKPADKAAEFVALRQRARDLQEKGDLDAAKKLFAQADDMLVYGGKDGSGGPSSTDRLRAAQTLLQNASNEAEAERAKRQIESIMSSGQGSAPAGGSFTVTAGGKTYTFPTQEAANKFKAEAGVK
jgi:hypothetical protein